MPYPSVITALTNPNATDRLNAPSHSSIHTSTNTEITALETFVGTLSSVPGTLMYDIRAAASNGGGHVQTANTGGTGQTNYNKGDLLVATSSSVLAKLAVSSVLGNVLVADPNQAAGMRWGNTVASKVAVVSSLTGVSSSSVIATLFAASIVGSTLGTNNAVRFTGAFSNVSFAQGRNLTFNVNYGNNNILSMGVTGPDADIIGLAGRIEGMIVADGTDTAQKATGGIFITAGASEAAADLVVKISKGLSAAYGTASVVSSADQNLVITTQIAGATPLGSVIGQFFVVEKIA